LGNEGSQGIEDLIRGEAANRAARDRLEDYRDSLEQQKVAAKKGNYQAAQTAGREASRDLQAATTLSLQGAQAGNAQAISMYSALQQGDIGKATVQNQGQQLQLSAVDQQNRNALGIAQLQQQGSISKATLAAQEKRYAGMDEANKARIMQARSKGLSDFMQNEGAQLRTQLAKDYGANFLTATDARSLEAQRIFNQRKQAYLADITGQAIDALSARSADALLGQ
jgi:ABC-type lipopolysaccharide export system ATPase subunit